LKWERKKVAAYVVTQIQVRDATAYEEYKKGVPATLALYDGKFLARGGRLETLEGDWKPERFVILEFPSIERAQAWHRSPEYQAIVGIRYDNATSQMIVVEGAG